MATATFGGGGSQSAPASLQSGVLLQLDASENSASTAITVLADDDASAMVKRDERCDLELHLLRAFGELASSSVLGSYAAVKRSSRLAGSVAGAAEHLVVRSGVAAVVGALFAQLERAAQPWVRAADDAVGRRVVDLLVGVLLLASAPEPLEGANGELAALGRLSIAERVQALLRGELPRVEALLQDARRREREALEAHRAAEAALEAQRAAPVVMDLSDFVRADEVARRAEAHAAQLQAKSREVAALKEQLEALERARQRLEQDLTDVHSYQESERGRRFQQMEEELARAKLEASQKAHNLRKLEIVVETLRSRKRKGSKSARSDAGKSATTSDGGASTSPRNDVATA